MGVLGKGEGKAVVQSIGSTEVVLKVEKLNPYVTAWQGSSSSRGGA